MIHEPRTCENCGRSFVANHGAAKHCTISCRNKAYVKRKKEAERLLGYVATPEPNVAEAAAAFTPEDQSIFQRIARETDLIPSSPATHDVLADLGYISSAPPQAVGDLPSEKPNEEKPDE